MNVAIDFGQVIAAVAAAIVLQGGIVAVGFIVFRAQASEWHKANLSRFGRIEKALGIDDPDEVAFVRRSEAEAAREAAAIEQKRVWKNLGDHERRIIHLEQE